MKVFLLKDVPGVGKAQQVVTVADGHARNYLLPRKLAVRATEGRINTAKQHAQSEIRREDRAREQAQAIAAELEDKELNFKVKAGETGRLYGSITSADIAEKLTRLLDSEFDKRWVLLDRPIRDVGNHTIELKLEGGVRGHINVAVEATEV
jgi:large subunit ribosomal protein L9